MEMYADPHSRGGVLEPEGTVEIKYKDKDIKATMRRLDEKYKSLLAGQYVLTISNFRLNGRWLLFRLLILCWLPADTFKLYGLTLISPLQNRISRLWEQKELFLERS